MPRITHVKKAQQRYAVKPVIDPATGQQKVVPVVNQRTGEQKLTKSGRPVFLRVTERDLDRPLPMPRCDYCRTEITVGSPYKWIEPSGQPVRNRHEKCPSWNVWEYSSSLSARIAQIQDGDPGEVENEDDLRSWLEEKAAEIRELAEEKRESAQNIEDGFGHSTYQSDELNETADSLESWADEVEEVGLPEMPEPEEEECSDCGGAGNLGDYENPNECETCGGNGTITSDEPTPEQVDEWREEAIQAARDALDNCPV